jgi:hypothetical protein
VSSGFTAVNSASASLTGWRCKKLRKLARMFEVDGVEPSGSQGTTIPIRMAGGGFPVTDRLA